MAGNVHKCKESANTILNFYKGGTIMKRRIGLLLCIVTLLTSSGCVVKKEASTTGETSNEITVEITPEVTVETTPNTTEEPTKEHTDMNNNPVDNKNTDNANQNSTYPNENYNKTEPTPEFYDFMNLDPDVDINNEQVKSDIGNKISNYLFHTAKPEFTKKELFLYELTYKNNWHKEIDIEFYLNQSSKDFYSNKTKSKLKELGFIYKKAYEDNDNIFNAFTSTEKEHDPIIKNMRYKYELIYTANSEETREQYIEKVTQALKILLQDHNVVYFHVYFVTHVPV